MKSKILDFIDFERLNTLLEGFNRSTGFVTAILDLEGNILSHSGWRKICTDFHRVHPESAMNCSKSDTELANRMGQDQKYYHYQCLNGLIDVAVPIVLEGDHVANLFTGQFFFEPPDIPFFKKQARIYGFDEEAYLRALEEVPVVSREKVETLMGFLLDMTQLVSELTFQKMEKDKLIETTRTSKAALEERENRISSIFRSAPVGIGLVSHRILQSVNKRLCEMTGFEETELIGQSARILYPGDEDFEYVGREKYAQIKDHGTGTVETRWQKKDGTIIDVLLSSTPLDLTNWSKGVTFTALDISAQKRMQQAIEKRILALTRPLGSITDISFDELFDINTIQRIQDEFAEATNVASIITHTDGTPITEPSNFTCLCHDIIRKTEKGCANCFKSDAVLGRVHPDGPVIQHCLGAGLWDAGVSIIVGDQHIANWLIGQVRDEDQTEEAMRAYAREIGADESAFIEAFHQVPMVPQDRFGKIAQALFTLANQLSTAAYLNLQQARFIAEERKTRDALTRLSTAIEQSPEMVVITDTDGVIQYVNPGFEKITGYEASEVLGQNPRLFRSGRQDEAFYKTLWQTISAGKTWKGRLVNKRKDGSHYTEESTISPVLGNTGRIINYVAVKRDISEQEALAEQLVQAQKMESVGRLAGGVAHDFNNMLGVIMGYTELALTGLSPEDKLRTHLTEVQKAADRSAGLTRQLLAFARKQTVSPRVIDLNETVEGMLNMLRRIIGEDIELIWRPGKNLAPVRIDPSQVDQILANLCVNAKDAISGGGRLTIETANISLDSRYCTDHSGYHPGDYVLLTVSDDGCGMEREIIKNIFEPFFTTKELGKGTGLGLATVYGMVKQNSGFINVYSEPGQGTTFKIFLPRHSAQASPPSGTRTEEPAQRGHETILLVEDEPTIRVMTALMLRDFGYTVLEASGPGEAIRLAQEHSGVIHLLMTDVVMPEMNGRDLARNILSIYPDIKRLFMSGYTADVIAHHGVIDEGVNFIQKPFSILELSTKVRGILDGDT